MNASLATRTRSSGVEKPASQARTTSAGGWAGRVRSSHVRVNENADTDMLAQSLLERSIARHQEQVRYLIGAGDRHLCPRLARQRCEFRRPRLEGSKTHDHGVPIALSALGQANARAGALEQARAEVLLEARHLTADCRLRSGKLDRGLRDAALARGALEGDQGSRGRYRRVRPAIAQGIGHVCTPGGINRPRVGPGLGLDC